GTDANGCSNTDAVDVTVNLIYYNLLNITTCSGDSVYAGGNYQTTSGIYVDSLQSTDGCDSIVETTLTISSQIIANLSVSVCYGDSALINGSYQAASGIFYDTTINASGCDSVTVTSFTVDNLISSSASAEICSGDSLFIGGAYQSTAGNYVDTFSAVSGCDSLVTTTLTVNTASSSTDTHQAACDFTWIDGITYTASNSTATFITSNALGCDSVVTLDLTINPIIATIAQNGNDIEATASNGTAPYYYEWNTGETTATITPNVNGPYWVVVSDADTCYSDTASFDVTFVSGTGIKTINDILSIYPNPTNENVIISIDNYYGNIKTEVFDLIGNKLQTTSKISISLRDYSKGIYILKVTYGNIVEEIKVIKE
ncbi:MAG: T9SS type A sorting domain-containing protein, partial [Flavobacteriales bacterium]